MMVCRRFAAWLRLPYTTEELTAWAMKPFWGFLELLQWTIQAVIMLVMHAFRLGLTLGVANFFHSKNSFCLLIIGPTISFRICSTSNLISRDILTTAQLSLCLFEEVRCGHEFDWRYCVLRALGALAVLLMSCS